MSIIYKNICLAFLCGAIISSGSVFGEERDGSEVLSQLGERSETTKIERLELKAKRAEEELSTTSQEEGRESETARIAQEITTVDGESAEGAVEASTKTSEKASVTYLTTHEGVWHSVSSLTLFGDYVTLNDGLSWYVRPADRYKTGNFGMVAEYDYFLNTYFYYYTDNILILPGSIFSLYDYVLVNQTTGDRLEVDLVQPIPGQLISTYTVIGVSSNAVYLQDGSVWSIAGGDQGMLWRWAVGDSITVGLNDGLFSSFNPNI